MKNLLIFVIGILEFCSCGDVFTPFRLYIENQTTDTIKLVFTKESSLSVVDSTYLVFLPNTKKMLYGADHRYVNDGCYTNITKDNVTVQVSSGKSLVKEIWNIDNWNCTGAKHDGWTLTFVITEVDLE